MKICEKCGIELEHNFNEHRYTVRYPYPRNGFDDTRYKKNNAIDLCDGCHYNYCVIRWDALDAFKRERMEKE